MRDRNEARASHAAVAHESEVRGERRSIERGTRKKRAENFTRAPPRRATLLCSLRRRSSSRSPGLSGLRGAFGARSGGRAQLEQQRARIISHLLFRPPPPARGPIQAQRALPRPTQRCGNLCHDSNSSVQHSVYSLCAVLFFLVLIRHLVFNEESRSYGKLEQSI